MRFEELVARIGPERYQAACDAAWGCAAGTGRCGGARSWPSALQDVPHEFSDLWWHGDASLSERLEIGLRLYREMPCYANTMELNSFYREFSPHDKRRFWDAYRAALEDPDARLADPVSYSLWVDFFEDPATVEEAWRKTTIGAGGDVGKRRIARVLDVAGPVPWALKEALFEQIHGDRRLHHAIFRAIAGSAFDVYGQTGPSAARWLERLALPDDTPDLAALRARVGSGRGRAGARSS